MKYRYIYILSLFVLLQSCSSSKKYQQSIISKNSTNYFTGLVVYNPENGDTLISQNASNYFTPASTVKLFTLYTALNTLSDSIATVSYHKTADRFYFKPLADPSFLHDSLPNSTFDFLKKQTEDLILVPDDFSDFVYGSGWQWDDYEFYYMPEKSLFPIYGNLATLSESTIIPPFFNKSVRVIDTPTYNRDFTQNIFYKNSIPTDIKREIPFKTSLELSRQLLSDTLHRPVYIVKKLNDSSFTPYKSTPTKALYNRLMHESENFIAEQLFLIIAKEKTGSYQVKNTIDYALDSLLSNIPDSPRWVDASGLSRYNLFTPNSMIYLLNKMYNQFGKNKTLGLLPKNGENGSLQKWYPSKTTNLYAKTGSLSNNHNICGFIKTKKGTLLIFSYMNNNYTQESSSIRKSMNKVLQQIYNEH